MPAYAASVPSTRSSSVGWPTDSCTWSCICSAPITTVVTPEGQGGAREQRRGLLCDPRRLALEPERRHTSQPPCALDPVCALG